MLVKSAAFLILLILASVTCAQPVQIVMQAPRKIVTPRKLSRVLKQPIKETRTIDFDGDGKKDYLAFVSSITGNEVQDDEGYVGFEFWVTSAFKIVKRTPRENAVWHDRWFVNLDDDRVPEVIYALLYDDSTEISVYKQNFSDGKDELLFDLNPVLIDRKRRNREYWGYAWDLTNIIARRNRGVVEVLCALSDDAEFEQEPRDGFRRVPIVFFTGTTTQSESIIRAKLKRQWLPLQALSKAAR